MKTRLIISLTALMMLAGISVNAQNSNQTPSTSSIIGDLNGDNKVNAADVVLLVDHINNLSIESNTTPSEDTSFAKEDINKDGYVNSADVKALVCLIMYGDYKILIDKTTLQCLPEEGSYTIIVSSKVKWDIDKSKIDESWCEVSKSTSSVTIKVKENTAVSGRQCKLKFYSPDIKEIESETLTIKQEPNVKLSKKDIMFTPSYRSETIYFNVTGISYNITSCPEWCQISNTSGGFIVYAEESLCLERDGLISVKISINGEKIDRSVKIKQKPLCPDDHHPHMIDLGLPSGTKWSCCNTGASSPEKYGNHYSWGNKIPLIYNGSYYDSDYPYKEWKDTNFDGIYNTNTWEETIIKVNEAYTSVISSGWGNGKANITDIYEYMASTDDYTELKEKCEMSRNLSIGECSGVFFTSKNGNSIFIPIDSSGAQYWTFNPQSSWAWISSYFIQNGGVSHSLGYYDPNDVTLRSRYFQGRLIRYVYKTK